MDKNQSAKVSVIIPTYNHAQYLVETIQSVLQQSFRDFELIVVNDGSSDQTENILKPYIDAGLIHYLRQENQGVAIARNNGLSLAVGEYIAFLDDDDLWPSDKLAWQVDFLDHSDAALIGGGCYSDASKDPEVLANGDAAKQLQDHDLFRRNPFSSPGQTLLRRSAMDQVGGFDPEIWGADDLDLWMRLLSAGPLFISKEPALFYRLHEHNASSDAMKMATNLEKVFKKNLKLFPVAKQTELERLGFRFIFRYCGRKIIWEAIEHLLAARLLKANPLLQYGLSNFLPRFRKDPLFLIYIISAILSAPMKIHRKKRRLTR